MKRLLLFATLVLCSPAFAQDAMFRGNPQHTGGYPGPGVTQFTKIKWQFHTNLQVLSSPVVSESALYVGSSDHNLYALDAATGQLKWKFKTAGERRFAATHLHGAEPAAELMPDPFDFYLSSPVIVNGVVYFGSGDTNIYALDAATGNLKWKFKTGDVVHASPTVSNGTLFVGSWDSFSYALDASTGKLKWHFQTGEDPDTHNQVGIQSSAAIADGIVYFGCRDSKFYAVDAATGKQLWSFPNKGSWVIASPAVQDGKVYFATSDSGLFHALDAKSGAPIFSLDNKHWPMFSSSAISGQTLYIGSHEGKLLAIDLKTQKFVWTFQTEGSKQNGSTYTKPDGTPKYEAAFSDFFYDDMVVGTQKMLTFGAVLSSPVIANATIYIASTDGNIYAIE